MPESVSPRRPSDLDADKVMSDDGVTVVVGAPHIGKTEQFNKLADETELTCVESLTAASETEGPVVVDDFYTAYQHAASDDRREFLDTVTDASQLCLSTRPRDLDWLCTTDLDLYADTNTRTDTEPNSDSDPAADTDVDAEGRVNRDLAAVLHEALDAVIVLAHPPGDPPDWESVDGLASENTLETHAGHLTYDYAVNADGVLADRFADAMYGPTLVPPVALSLDTDADTDTREWLTGSLREYVGATGLSMATTPFKTLGQKAADHARAIASGEVTIDANIDRETLANLVGSAGPTTVSALSGSMPFVFALGLLLWRANPGDDMADLADGLFDHLLDDRLTPLDKARLETGLGLPPRTLDSLDDLVDSDLIDALVELPALQSDVETLQTELRDHRKRLETVEDGLADLAVEVHERREKATGGLAHLETRLQNEEEVLLGERVHPDDVEYLPDEDANEVDQLRDCLEDDTTDVVVLRGPHGAGKTTAAYKAFRDLVTGDESGYEVWLPRFGEANSVEQTIDSSDEQTILYANYQTEVGLGADGENEESINIGTVDSRQQLRELQSWSCDHATVVIECRDELHNSFTDKAPGKITKADRVKFERFDKKADAVRETTRWALDVLDYDNEYEPVVDEVVDLADGNIEIAKLAARYAATEDERLSAFDSAMELVHHDVQPVLDADAEYGDVGKIYEQVCVTPGVQTQELRDMFEGNITKSAKTLSGYLGGRVTDWKNENDNANDGETVTGWDDYERTDDTQSVNPGDTWRPRPIIYGRAVVEYEIFRTPTGNVQPDPHAIQEDLREYLQRYEVTDDPSFALIRLAKGLGSLYESARRRDADDLADAIYKVGVRWLLEGPMNDHLAISDDMDDEEVARRSFMFVGMMEKLLFHEVPVPATIFEQNTWQLLIGVQIHADQVDTHPVSILNNLFAYICTNSRDIGREHLDALEPLLADLAATCDEEFDEDPSQFLLNVNAMALLNLANESPNPKAEAVKSWVDELERQAIVTAGRDDVHGTLAGGFLANMYAMAVTNLVNKEVDPDAEAVKAWVDELERRAKVMARRNDAHDIRPGRFLANVYAMALLNLVDREEDPDAEAVEAWVDEVESRAEGMARQDDAHNLQPWRFLANVHALVLGKLADKSTNPTADVVETWVNHITEQVSKVAASDIHSKPPAEFVARTYGFGVAQVFSGDSEGSAAWGQTLADHAIEMLPVSEPGLFYDASVTALTRVASYNSLPWLVGDVLDRSVETESPVGETREQRVELVAELVVDIAEGFWSSGRSDGFNLDVFNAVTARVGTAAETSVGFFHEVATRVADSLADADTDDGDAEVDPSEAWLARVYPAALAALAGTDSDTPEDLDAVYEQGCEKLADASQVALTEYHARALGAFPRNAVADWHDQAASRARDDLGADASAALYRVGLQHVRDWNGLTAMQCLAGVWYARDTLTDDQSTVSERAGIGYAASLKLSDSDDTDMEPSDVLDTLPDGTDDRPAAVRAVAAVLAGRNPDVTPDKLRANIDPDADGDLLADLETLAYSDLLEVLTKTPRDDYETALRRISRDGDPQQVTSTLRDVWERRNEVDEDSDEYEAVLGAGVLLGIHAFGRESVDVDPDDIRETVSPHRDHLSDPIRVLFDRLSGKRDSVDLDELCAGVDPDTDDELDVADLETLVVAGIIDGLQSEPETHDDTDVDVWEVYGVALTAIAENEMQDAVTALVCLWDERDSTEVDSDEYEAILAAGILFAGLLPAIGADLDVEADSICDTVAPHRDRLSDSVQTLFAYLDDELNVDPAEMLERADIDDPDFEALETVAVASVLDLAMRHDEAAPSDETGAPDVSSERGSDVNVDYRIGLEHILAGKTERATNVLLDVWDVWPAAANDAEREERILSGGVALAVLVADDTVFGSLREEVANVVGPRRETLPNPARPVANRLVDADSVSVSLSDTSATDGDPSSWSLADVERAAFERLADAMDTL